MSSVRTNQAQGLDLQHWDISKDGDPTETAIRRKLTRLGYECRRYQYPPGTRFSEHCHPADKIDAVVSGNFRITSGTDSIVLGPGDYVYVPQGVMHSAEVIGNETVISIDGVKINNG
jgi:quercetin dioxygenase-like cupin family protein